MTDHRYTDQQIRNLEKVIKARFQGVRSEFKAVRDAVNKVDKTTNAKFDSVNEFRNQLKDQAGSFVTRRELLGAVTAGIGVAISIMQLLK